MADELSPVAPATGSETDTRVAGILAQIIALASGNLEARGELSGARDELDAITGGLNMIAEELGSKIHALEKSEARYRLITENASDVIWTRGLDLKLQFVTPAVFGLRGFTVAEALSQTAEETMTAASVAALQLAMIEELDRDGEEGVDPRRSRTLELELLRKDGSTVWVEMSGAFLRDPDGKPVGAVGITRDISERKTMEHRTAHLQSALQQAQRLEAIGRLAGGVAHDFNNLLTAILGYSEIVETALPEADPLRSDVGEIRRTAERAATLTRQLLAFSRKQIVTLQVLDLNACYSRAQAMLERIIGEDIEIQLNLAPDLWPVELDPGQFDQILLNLMVNARDAMPDGGTLIVSSENITLDGDAQADSLGALPGDYACLSLADTGTGMAPETVELIFEPFFSTKPKDIGTGLGLSTVFGIVKQHHGYITVDTALGKGASIRVHFPRSEKRPRPGGTEQAQESLQHGSETVLLVEDEEIVRKLTQSMLEQLGYTVIEAISGDDAMKKFERHADEIHLVLTDVIMPGMNGREVANAVRNLRPQIKVVFMSGYTDDTIAQHGVLEPGSHFLQKPFTYAALTQIVRQVLDG